MKVCVNIHKLKYLNTVLLIARVSVVAEYCIVLASILHDFAYVR